MARRRQTTLDTYRSWPGPARGPSSRPPRSSGDRPDTPILSNSRPETNDVPSEPNLDDTRGLPTQLLPKDLAVDVDPDDETVSSSTKKHEPWRELGRPDFALYLTIEETVRASVLLGAAAYRAQRVRGVDGPAPSSGLELVATLISFESLDDMPDDLTARCSWFTPESDRYDFADTFPTDLGTRLLRVLLERHQVETLRNHLFTIDDLPLLGNEEGNMMRTLVAPLEDENRGSLPWLIWRDPSGFINASRIPTGHSWTMVDNDLPYTIEHLFDSGWEVSPFEDETGEVNVDGS